MRAGHRGFGAEQVGSANLNGRGSERQSGRDAATVGDAAVTGTFTASTTCGTSAIVLTWRSTASARNVPRCPPASRLGRSMPKRS